MSKESMLQGLGLATSLVSLLIEAVREAGGKSEDLHRLTKPEGRETLAKVAKVIAEDAGEKYRVPKDGDEAFTVYHGREYVGVLSSLTPIAERYAGRCLGSIVPKNPMTDWGFHDWRRRMRDLLSGENILALGQNPMDWRGLTVGYDDPIVWDDDKGMWYAPADSD